MKFIIILLCISNIVLIFGFIGLSYRFNSVRNEFYRKINDLRKIELEDDILHTNEKYINSMDNVHFLEFIKERFNLPDYCKMCQRFNPRDNDETICRFKGMYEYCRKGFEEWLHINNDLEGDMDANIN